MRGIDETSYLDGDRMRSEWFGSVVIGCAAVLTVLFVVLKATHVIAWPWSLVLAPFWGGLVLFFGFLLVRVLRA